MQQHVQHVSIQLSNNADTLPSLDTPLELQHFPSELGTLYSHASIICKLEVDRYQVHIPNVKCTVTVKGLLTLVLKMFIITIL